MNAIWETPRIAVEKFIANDYVSVCFGLSCQMGKYQDETDDRGHVTSWGHDNLPTGYDANTLWGTFNPGNLVLNDRDGDHKEYDEHANNGVFGNCSSVNSNFVSENADGTYSIYEYNSEQKRNLNGVLTFFGDINGDKRISAGEAVAWVTYNASAYWRHWAYADLNDANHPNRS